MIEKTSWFQLQPLYRHLRQQAENKKTYKYVEIGATFFLIAIFLSTAIAPTAKAISTLLGEIKSKEILEKKLKNKIDSIILAQTNYSLMQEESRYQILESSFPSRPRYYDSAVVFSSAATQSNNQLDQLSFKVDPNESLDSKPQNPSFSLNSSTQSEYRSLLDMINKIKDNRRLVDIESLQINQIDKKEKSSSSSSSLINLSLSTNLFFLPTILNEQK